MIDTIHRVEAPEGVDLALRLAGPVPRALAFAFDGFLRGIFYVFAGIALGVAFARAGLGMAFLLVALGEVLYPVAFELLADGQTLGKRVVGIRVVHEDGTRIRWQASLLRNLLVIADALPGTYLFAAASMLCSPRFQRIGDHAAGTLVVYVERPRAPAPPLLAALPPAAPAIPITPGEQSAVLAFAARSRAFSAARREELASLAAPLLSPSGSAAEQLEAVAAHLRGAERGR